MSQAVGTGSKAWLTCVKCDKGHYQEQTGQPFCLPCIPGKHQPEKGALKCEDCGKDTFTKDTAQTTCQHSGVGFVVLAGGAAAVKVPDGSYITNCQEDDCDSFLACPAGSKGTLPPSTNCEKCEPGRASTLGAVSCAPCEAGKFSQFVGSFECTACDQFAGEYSSIIETISCKTCAINEVSVGTKCTEIPIDRTLPVPKNVVIERTSTTNFNDIQIRWTADGDGASSFIVSISTSADFDTKVANVTQLKTTKNEITFISMNDIRKTVLFAKVESVGNINNKISGSSVVSKEWPSTDGNACLDINQYINCTSLNPSDWHCEQCPEGSSCKGSITWKDAKAVFGWSRCKDDLFLSRIVLVKPVSVLRIHCW
jgi:hypothetical protein